MPKLNEKKYKRPIRRPGNTNTPAYGQPTTAYGRASGVPPGLAKKGVPPGLAKTRAGLVKNPKQPTHGVAGNTKFRSRLGLGDLRRAVKRRDKTTVTRAAARQNFITQARKALTSNVDKPRLGKKLKARGYLKNPEPPAYGKDKTGKVTSKKKKKART